MPRPRPDDPRVDELLLELETAEHPDLDLLARHARGEALPASERAEVEAAMAARPAVADEVRLLRGFDFEALAREAAQRETRDLASRTSLWARLREWFGGMPAWLPVSLAAAAALALAFYLYRPGVPGPTPAEQIARVEEVKPSSPAPGPEPAEPAPAGEKATPGALESIEPRLGAGEQLHPAERPAPPREEPGRDAPTMLAERPPSREPEAPRPSQAPEPAPDDEPIFVAMLMPEYETPPDSPSRPRSRTVVRGPEAQAPPAITLLVPEHVARTSQPSPTLYWHASREIETGQLTFLLVDAAEPDPLASIELPLPAAAGVHAVDLATHRIEIPAGRELQWSISLTHSPDEPPAAHGTAWILRQGQTLPAPADAGATAASYASAGLWYDALAHVMQLRTRLPGNTDVSAAEARLLEQAGLADLSPR